LVSSRLLTTTPSGKRGVHCAITSCVSSVLALSTITMRSAGVVMAAALRSRSLSRAERLNVTIAIATMPPVGFTPTG